MPKAEKIAALMERLAPPDQAESWDNVGLMVGSNEIEVKKVALALDPTRQTIQAAYDAGAQLLLTHHPLIFHPLKRLDLKEPTAATVALALNLNVTVISAHTNLDAAQNGVSWTLARQLSLKNIRTLAPNSVSTHMKLVVFVPLGYEKEVRDALFQAGAGRIGVYSGCSFATKGEGTFIAPDNAHPFVGETGEMERVSESRLEVFIEKANIEQAVEALLKAHPYEEVAYDLYPLAPFFTQTGIGCIGQTEKILKIEELVDLVKRKLNINNLRLAVCGERPIETVAVVGGSGGQYVGQAKATGAQVLISGDFGYHQAREAQALGIALIDAGHFATERPVLSELMTQLTKLARAEGLEVEFEIVDGERDPWLIM